MNHKNQRWLPVWLADYIFMINRNLSGGVAVHNIDYIIDW